MKQEIDDRPWIDADTFKDTIDLIKIESYCRPFDKPLLDQIIDVMNASADLSRQRRIKKENERLKQELNLLKGK